MIRNYKDLAAHLCVDYDEDTKALDRAISRRVYKDTICGAWAALETVPVGKKVKQQWKVDIRRGVGHFKPYRARRAKGRKWYPVEEWPEELLWFVAMDEGLNEYGHIQSQTVLDFLKNEVEWYANKPKYPRRYFDAEIEVFKGQDHLAVTFGSIVEGVEACCSPRTVTLPCRCQQISEAIQAVEDEAKEIWDNTHGCEHCWEGADKETRMWVEVGFDGYIPVNPECPWCGGKGVVI